MKLNLVLLSLFAVGNSQKTDSKDGIDWSDQSQWPSKDASTWSKDQLTEFSKEIQSKDIAAMVNQKAQSGDDNKMVGDKDGKPGEGKDKQQGGQKGGSKGSYANQNLRSQNGVCYKNSDCQTKCCSSGKGGDSRGGQGGSSSRGPPGGGQGGSKGGRNGRLLSQIMEAFDQTYARFLQGQNGPPGGDSGSQGQGPPGGGQGGQGGPPSGGQGGSSSGGPPGGQSGQKGGSQGGQRGGGQSSGGNSGSTCRPAKDCDEVPAFAAIIGGVAGGVICLCIMGFVCQYYYFQRQLDKVQKGSVEMAHGTPIEASSLHIGTNETANDLNIPTGKKIMRKLRDHDDSA